ncbi:uncharacterized protein [Centruroides vittatus]|uniref:uncharacterized protein isoform X2 n=1 Tax=Centruroides vittatus TaxID=120091 RepID=UPI00350F15D6
MRCSIIWIFIFCQLSSAKQCLHDKEQISKRYFYSGDTVLPIYIEASKRPTHKLVSNILKILLQEKLGYHDTILLLQDEAVACTATLQRITGCFSPEKCKKVENFDSTARPMINLEVWIGPGFNLDKWSDLTEIEDCGPLGPIGRSDWYISEKYVKDKWNVNETILDHWRSYQDSDIVTPFNLLNEPEILTWVFDKESNSYYCSYTKCENGIFSPPLCQNSNVTCATLLADYPESSYRVLKDQIIQLKLFVNVAWVGPHLENIVRNRFHRNEPTLFFYWKPSALISSKNFTHISFPSCRDNIYRSSLPCEFEISQLEKVIWKKLKSNAPLVYQLVNSMNYHQTEYIQLLKYTSTDKTIEEAACIWIKENEYIWSKWLPDNIPDKTVLYIGGIFPVTGPYKELAGVVPAAELAVDAVNKNNSILKNYKLELLIQDGRCMADVVMKTFISYVTNSSFNRLIGILGSACSDTVEPIAGVAKHFNSIIISYSAEGALFNNREKYPFFLRTTPENNQLRFVFLKLFLHFGWHRIAALTEDGQNYPEYLSLLHDLLQSQGLNFISNRKFPRNRSSNNMSQYLLDLKNKKARIIIGVFYDSTARAIMCEAYKQKMTAYQGYQWFLPAWFSNNWFDTDYFNTLGESIPCTTEQMSKAIDGHITLIYTFYADPQIVMQEGKTIQEWTSTYKTYASSQNRTISKYGGYAYDAVWVYALALDNLLNENDSMVAILHSDTVTRKFISLLMKTNFMGVSGRVKFVGSSRLLDIVIWQWHGNVTREIGRYIPISEENGSLEINKSAIVWLTHDGRQPSDGMEDPEMCSVEQFRAMLNVSCELALVIMNILGFSIFALVLSIVFILLKRRYEEKMKLTKERIKELGLVAAHNLLALDEWEIPRNHVVINRKLGEGAFGTVYGGETFIESKGWVAAAVKTLKIGASVEEKLDFLSEADMMKRFNHHNIVSLLGVCTKGEPVYMIMEFMLYGNLKTYLLSRRNLVKENETNEEVSSFCLTNMALDIARGLSYLAEMKYVHRDLACRNCLVNARRVVKIGDFGLCKPVFDCDCYKFKGKMPIRWMAPESLSKGIFSPMTDIWSYGVLLYEMVTFGSFPFQGFSNNQVYEHIINGKTLSVPKQCKTELKMLMLQCWYQNPQQRPMASQIVEILANKPNLISPCLDAPLASVEVADVNSSELAFPDLNQLQPSPPHVWIKQDQNPLPIPIPSTVDSTSEAETANCLESSPLMNWSLKHINGCGNQCMQI